VLLWWHLCGLLCRSGSFQDLRWGSSAVASGFTTWAGWAWLSMVDHGWPWLTMVDLTHVLSCFVSPTSFGLVQRLTYSFVWYIWST
jgi:hypothetical protein